MTDLADVASGGEQVMARRALRAFAWWGLLGALATGFWLWFAIGLEVYMSGPVPQSDGQADGPGAFVGLLIAKFLDFVVLAGALAICITGLALAVTNCRKTTNVVGRVRRIAIWRVSVLSGLVATLVLYGCFDFLIFRPAE
ncbi:hypothetical protein Back2_20310 [Nocardioides baekrokdamisoli]|uniref:Uncharacterized protein n=1 Tax=Nocardioides baekrokdamisoli TaxID=1804624 RepID=A0A3G9J2S0_9ACTN|nr:hypothetical protein [Nocardioides baekrokdamisoli]BBH17744.1 hypothetical protein Back2_20310 [Nocardioides baekrokdamisoli]